VERPTIAVIPKGTTHEFWKTVHAGAVKGARDAEVDIIWKGPAREDSRDEQIKVVENFISRGIDGILIAPLDASALVGPLKEAQAAGIPVVIFDSGINWDEHESFIATDNYQGGLLAGRTLGAFLEGSGSVVMMRYVEGSASTTKREEGFLEAMRSEFPGIKILSETQYGGATVESCQQTAENLLNRYGSEVDGLFAPCEPVTVAFMNALDGEGMANTVHLVGFDASETLVNGLEEGSVHALVVQSPFAMGEMGIGALADILAGRSVEAFIDTGCAIITRQNMHEPAHRQLLAPDLEEWLGR